MKNIIFSIRKLYRNKLLLWVGIPSLAIGLAVVLLLVSYLRREYSFDKHFSTKDRVVRLYNTVTEGGDENYGICLRKSYDEIPQKIAEVEASTQIYDGWTNKLTAIKTTQSFSRLRKLYADKTFFQVFAQRLLVGDKESALKGKNKIVLTASTAQKIFGTINCVGEQIYMEFFTGSFNHTVSGVIEDLPENSHLQYDLLVSMETLPLETFGGLEFLTYFLIKDNTDVQLASKKIAQVNDEIMQSWMKGVGVRTQSKTVLLNDVHFFSNSTGGQIVPSANTHYLWIVASITILVLLIALVNFINLYSLHSSERISEIAMRKSLGASRTGLAQLFFTDTLVMALIAFILSLGLTVLASPYFSQLLNSKISLKELFNTAGIVTILIILGLIVFSAGIYPLLKLSRMNLSLGVKGKTKKINKKGYATKTALVLQFGITAFMIASLVIFYAQVSYMKAIPLGFSPDNIEAFYASTQTLKQKITSLKEEVEKLPFVQQVSSSEHSMGHGCSGQSISRYGSNEEPIPIDEYRVQSGFAKIMKMQLIDGNYFSVDNAENEVILNEAAVKKLELSPPLVGKKVNYKGEKIIKGVVKDFYYIGNSGQSISPLVLAAYSKKADVIYVSTNTPITPKQKLQIVEIFKKFDNTYVMTGFNLSSVYQRKFRQEDKIMKMVSSGALLAILLSISGLIALSLLNVNRRTKEIGVRKVMGSTEKQVLHLLIKQVLVWVTVACTIGFLVNYYVMQQVLQNFVNQVSITPIYFIISALVVLLISLLAVSWQSWRAATKNPIEALRYE